jgi:starch synthase
MRILLASSEVHPYSKTGGLADMVGALAKTLARLDNEVVLVTPLYAGIADRFPGLQRVDHDLNLPLGPGLAKGSVFSFHAADRLIIYFVDQPEFYDRPELYHQNGVDYPDNAARFLFLSKAVVDLARNLPFQPEVVHVHDWQTGFVPLLIHHATKAEGWAAPPATCITLHNLAYQGVFPPTLYSLSNLPWDYFNPSGVEFYGKMSFLKAGIAFSKCITTVSPRYAREITTEAMGCGLDGLLRAHRPSLTGILNGADYSEWNPQQDQFIQQPFSAENLEGKAANKAALQKEFGLPLDASASLFGSIGRLVEQKGVDILLGALEEMLETKLQFVLIGTGHPKFESAFQDLSHRNPNQVSARIAFSQAMAHRVEAGCDFFLMPSHFEPCGLNQMYSLRYGTIPIVRATGGLDDSVIDATEDSQRANGIKFGEYSSRALAKAIRKALVLFAEPAVLKRFRINAMSADFSWDATAQAYLEVYKRAREQG